MTKKKLLFPILSALSVIVTLILGAYILFVPTENLNFFLVPIFLGIISILYLLRMLYFATDIIRKFSKLSFLQKFIKLIFSVVVVICTFFAGNAVLSSATLEHNQATSLISPYEISEEFRELFPFYDSFYEEGGEDTYYGLSLDNINECEFIRIDNRASADDENSSSYVAEKFRSVNIFLNLKYRFELIWESFKNDCEFREEYTLYTPENKKVKFYEGKDCYLAFTDYFTTIYCVELLYPEKSGITFPEFAKAATHQFELLADINEKQSALSTTEN